MPRLIRLTGVLMTAIPVLIAAQLAWPYPEFARSTKAACASCHANPAGGADLTDAGKAFKADAAKAPAAGAGADYVGANKCRMCHMAQHKSWAETPHAKAWAGLKNADPKVAAEMAAKLKIELKGSPAETGACVKCHVTGYQLTGGYPGADSTKTAALVNVTCEACHGPGSKHVSAAAAEKKKMINRAVTANMCTQCHTPEISPNFKFEEFKAKGVHAIAPPKSGS